mgnify:CR=1 FL=1
MSRQPFDLNLTSLDTLAVLIYGPYGCGKTHLQGDFLRWAAKKGGAVAFLNIRGEDGMSSLGAMGLGKVGYTADTMEEYESLLGDLRNLHLAALAVDSLPAVYELALIQKYQTLRYPDPKREGDAARAHWGQLSMSVKNAILLSRQAAPLVFWVSAWDQSDDDVGGGKGITPNLPGKLAQEVAGRFDFVGYLKAEALVASVQRTVSFAPNSRYLVRQRIARSINHAIAIPENTGGWEAIFTAMTHALKGTG